MHNFKYVTKAEWKPVKDELIQIIHKLQDEVRNDFTFQFHFVGSSQRNMITRDIDSNKGFDFDVNLEVNPDVEYSAEEIRDILRNALNRINRSYSTWCNFGYDYTEDSTRVLTIKVKDKVNSRILHSCDFCIVIECSDGRQQYIRYNKSQKYYSWEYQPKGYKKLQNKIEWIKQNGLWGNLRDYYRYKKNVNNDEDKHSRAIFAESVHEIWQKNSTK